MIPVCLSQPCQELSGAASATLTGLSSRSSKARRPAAQRLCADCAARAPRLEKVGLALPLACFTNAVTMRKPSDSAWPRVT